ncbi:MAG: hypothetical protein ACNA8W_00340 [Bradymonadaceae bacterium]
MKIHREHDPIPHPHEFAAVAQLERPPSGWTEEKLFLWTEEFSHFLEELRCSAERTLTEDHRQYLLHTLDFAISSFGDGNLARSALDLVREYAALHVKDNEDRTAAERALEKLALYSPRIQSYLEALTHSHWDLFEVVGLGSGAFELRRLHDDSIHHLEAPEMNQPFFIGHVVALRLVEMDSLTTAPLAIQFDQLRLSELVNDQETEFATGAWKQEEWADFMTYRGSFLILRHALSDMLSFDQLEADAILEAQEPQLELDGALYRELDEAFSNLEEAFFERPGAMEVFVRKVPSGQVFRLEDGGACPILLVFDSSRAHENYERYLSGDIVSEVVDEISFLRLWRLPASMLNEEDLAYLESSDLDPDRFGAALPSRVGPGLIFEDVRPGDANLLIATCRVLVQMLGVTRQDSQAA